MGRKKQTYLDTIENYVKYVANNNRTEFIERNPGASHQDADILYTRALELYDSNELFRNKLNTEYQRKKREVRERQVRLMENCRSLGDVHENQKKRMFGFH